MINISVEKNKIAVFSSELHDDISAMIESAKSRVAYEYNTHKYY